MNALKALARLWFTGLLYCLAIAGYLFYILLWGFRIMQRLKILPLLFLLILGVLGGFATYLFVPLQEPGREITLVIEPGTAVIEIARQLEEKNVTPSGRALALWLRLRGLEKQVQAGRHQFREHEGMLSATKKLLEADAIYEKVTIPEGLTIEQTASQIKQSLPIDSARFVALCRDSAMISSLGFDEKSLEGYLFPETYRFSPDAKSKTILRRLTEQFRAAFTGLPQTAIAKSMTPHAIVTLASIVEKEATLASERPLIAGVFHNRLRIGYPLGADPTVRYALQKFSGPLRVSELKNSSPYNTRVHRGLPPGPICSPGLGALRATVSPAETKDLYFVAKWDGSGAHDFSRTLKEHERKKWRIRRENQKRKMQNQR